MAREALLQDIFRALDQKHRGFISKVELSHILDAMQADAGGRLQIPEGLSPSKIPRDCKVGVQDLSGWFQELSVADLEDVKWFAESVVKVETELREVWSEALQRWREDLLTLQRRDLHRYLPSPRVSRWLQLRTKDPGLGFSLHEVETLFADDTAEHIEACRQEMQPFLQALALRLQLDEPGEALTVLQELAQLGKQRDLACLLIHEQTLGLATALVGRSQEVSVAACELLMNLLGHGLHEYCEHEQCHAVLLEFLEHNFDPCSLDMQAERQLLSSDAQRGPLHPPLQRISDWVRTLATLPSDLDRGEMLDKLIKYDEQRLLKATDLQAVPESLFCRGRTIPILLGRLDLGSHFSLHERRTPVRTHLLKFLLNVISSSGERGRRLFRAAGGMEVMCGLLRGDSWGEVRPERGQEEEQDADLDEASEAPCCEWGVTLPARYYPADFADDKFYGPKDRVLAAALLEYLGSEEVWGEHLMEEVLRSRELLQVLCRVPSGLNLLRQLLQSPRPLACTTSWLAKHFVELQMKPLLRPDLSQLGPAPFTVAGGSPEDKESLQIFRQACMEAEMKNRTLRLLAFMYHYLQAQGAEPLEDLEELCSLVASHLPCEAMPVTVAVFKAMQEAAGIRSSECLFLLRLTQLLRLRSPNLPDFVVDLEARLESLQGAPPEAIRLDAPVRPSLLARFPSSSITELVQSLLRLLRELKEPVRATRQELLILACRRLLFFMPAELSKQVEERLGLSEQLLVQAQEVLARIPAYALEAPFAPGSWERRSFLLNSPHLSLLQCTLEEQTIFFVHIGGTWMLWANSLDEPALTSCGPAVPAYFGLE